MARASGSRRRAELPEILAAILEARGATVSRNGMIWEAALPTELERALGMPRVRLVAAPAGRAARGAEMDAGLTERILLLGRSHGEAAVLVGPIPPSKGERTGPRAWVRLNWRIRYGSDEIAEEMLEQELPVAESGGLRAPRGSDVRSASPEEIAALPPPDPDRMAGVWQRAIRLLESRIRKRLRPHEDRARRELHREMRTLSAHYRSLIAEERAGRARRSEDREAGRMLQLKEDWERKLVQVIRQRALESEAVLVAAALVYGIPSEAAPRTPPEGGLTGRSPKRKLDRPNP